MDIWNDFTISHNGINSDGNYYFLETLLKDRETLTTVVKVLTVVESNMISFHISTNEKAIKKLKLPSYKHRVDYDYILAKKHLSQKERKVHATKCLSIGAGTVMKIAKDILYYWEDHGHVINKQCITRNTGNGKRYHRIYSMKEGRPIAFPISYT